MSDDEKKAILVSPRERDTIIAALRYWQRYAMCSAARTGADEMEIADNGREGPDARLSANEIDEHIEERINV